jgi:hypothetical protein
MSDNAAKGRKTGERIAKRYAERLHPLEQRGLGEHIRRALEKAWDDGRDAAGSVTVILNPYRKGNKP